MTTATVTTLRPERKPQSKSARQPSRKMARQQSRQRMAAVGLGGVAATLTGLSLSHLAHGIELVSHGPAWEGWAMAVGVDLGFVGLELSQICQFSKLTPGQDKLRSYAIGGTFVLSAIMNAFAFATTATTPIGMAAGVALGMAIPSFVYALTKIGATLYLGASKS